MNSQMTMKKLRRGLHRVGLPIALGAAAIAASADAGADDSKLIGGAACTATDPDVDDVHLSTTGILANETVNVYCPLSRDHTGNDLTAVTMYFESVASRAPFFNVVPCTLFARNPVDPTGSGEWDYEDETFAEGSASFDLTGFDSGSNWAYTVRCNMIDGDRLGGIRYSEGDS